VAPAPRTERALRAIDLVGLDGYESAYPRNAEVHVLPAPAR
jgi:hypothetical protein